MAAYRPSLEPVRRPGPGSSGSRSFGRKSARGARRPEKLRPHPAAMAWRQRRGRVMNPLRPRFVGARVSRVEDPRLLRGQGEYVGDVSVPGMLSVAFVRSPHAAARIGRIDAGRAAAMPGVVAVWTARDVPLVIPHRGQGLEQSVLASGEVRYVGEPVAVVVAQDPYRAEDAAEEVEIDYEPL